VHSATEGRHETPIFQEKRRVRISAQIPLWELSMLYPLALILIICWLLGIVSSYTLNGFIHILLVVAIILVLVRVIRGQKL
jgi:hypothetical protein